MAAASKRKVEIKSQQRLCALEPRLLQCVEQYAATAKWRGGAAAQQAFTSRMRQAARRMMETLQQNVTVNGEPWDPTLRDDDMEPKNRALLQQLHDTQTACFELLEKTAKYRKTRPSEVAALVRAQIAKADEELVAEAARQAAHPLGSERDEAAAGLPENLQNRLDSALRTINTLTERMPDVLSTMRELRRTVQTEIANAKAVEDSDTAGQASTAAAKPSSSAAASS